jgi:hypothetical protein
MHLKVFLKLKKPLKTHSSGRIYKKKTKKNHWAGFFYFKKRFFSTLGAGGEDQGVG